MDLRTPEPAQQRGLTYALPKARIALFMEMRLGKSLVAIRWAKHHALERVLVIAPNDTLLDWRDELIKENIPSQDIYVLEGSGLNKLAMAEEVDSGWVIVNYQAIRMVKHHPRKKHPLDAGVGILKLPWSGIILDESTAIRNPGSSTTKTLLKYSGHIMHRCLMTGLPNPNSELDYFCQMLFLNGSFMGHYNYWSFRERFYAPDPQGWNWYPKTGTTEQLRAEVHRLAFILSRKDAGVGSVTRREKRYVTMTPKQKRAYVGIERNFSYEDTSTAWAPVRQTWLSRLAGGFLPIQPRCDDCRWLPTQCESCKAKNELILVNDGKIRSIVNLLESELKKEQVVIWFRFNAELDAVADALDRARITYHTVKGGGDKEIVHAKKKDFTEGRTQVMLMQMMMGKYGWDLSASSTAIYYSNVYDWEVRAQSQDRIVNVRKREPLLLIDLVTKDTVDEDVVDVLQDRKVTAQLFNGRFQERILESLRHRYPPPPERRKLVKRVVPGDLL